MKIYNGRGTPIWVTARENGDGCILFQGKSYVMINSAEIGPVIAALQALTLNQPEESTHHDHS